MLAHNSAFVESRAYENLQPIVDPVMRRRSVIVTCMDSRLIDLLPKAFNIRGDAKVRRGWLRGWRAGRGRRVPMKFMRRRETVWAHWRVSVGRRDTALRHACGKLAAASHQQLPVLGGCFDPAWRWPTPL